MNYYERVQESIDFIEDNLENNIKIEEVAKKAYMSTSNFYRIFFAITGYQAKEYMINRRMSRASMELMEKRAKVIDIAMKYSYDSVDAFSRIFKKITGYTPSTCVRETTHYRFERMDVMKKYFVTADEKMLEQYPDIKVLRELSPMRVAYYSFYGKNPEDGAFEVMKRWVLENNLEVQKEGYRIFGYDMPDTDSSNEEYGYEVCVTIPKNIKANDAQVKEKVLSGGLYAVMSVERKDDFGVEIMRGWKRFNKWIEGSKYEHGKAQWLEEHLGFDDKFEHLGSVDLYMPIQEKKVHCLCKST